MSSLRSVFFVLHVLHHFLPRSSKLVVWMIQKQFGRGLSHTPSASFFFHLNLDRVCRLLYIQTLVNVWISPCPFK
ncbi:hypothetical protein BDR07DRAFT_994604 [Suillus spraguei]|nr:hypothetical protein BDR07DRAFT_994604 [Suillus spraguei]